MFRRRRSSDDDLSEVDETAEAGELDQAGELDEPEGESTAAAAAPARTDGPFDSEEAGDDAVERVDLGALRVPVPEGTELRVEIEESTGAVQAVNVVTEGSALQLGVYAAPRKAGIWDEVRASIASSITSSGGMAGEEQGALGTELRAKVPFDDGRRKGLQPARFLGVDGPRWFVRGVLTGAAAEDDAAAAPLVDVIRGCVVVRGSEARAPHEPLPMRLPQQAEKESAAAASPDLNPFKRGPEITEIR